MVQRMLLVLLCCLPARLFAQEVLPLLHLNQENGLHLNTVTALAEDRWGRMWMGTRIGLQVWDGQRLHTQKEVTDPVLDLYAAGDQLYCVTQLAVYRVDLWREAVQRVPLPKEDYYHSQWSDGVLTVMTNNYSDTLAFDGALQPLSKKELSNIQFAPEAPVVMAGRELELRDQQWVVAGTDTLPGSGNYVMDILGYSPEMAFVATHKGLVQLMGDAEANWLLQDERIECMLLDRHQNLWVGTTGNGVYLYHRVTLENHFYPIGGDVPGTGWGFLEFQGQWYAATSRGMMNLDSKGSDVIEELTKGIHCFSGIGTEDFMLIGTSLKGILKIEQGRMSTVHYNPDEVLDNMVLHFLRNEKGILVLTKGSFIQLDHNGKVLFKLPFDKQDGARYVMSMKETPEGYLAATTIGVLKLDKELETIKGYESPNARVFAMADWYQDAWWLASQHGGLFRLEKDSLVSVPFPDPNLLGLVSQDSVLWVSSFNQFYRLDEQGVLGYGRTNGFPMQEYNQSGIQLRNDNAIYLGGVGGVFRVDPQTLDQELDLPPWQVRLQGQLLKPDTLMELPYDQSQLTLEAGCALMTDTNRVALIVQQDSATNAHPNYGQVTVKVPYGKSEVRWLLREKRTGKQQEFVLRMHRAMPFWLSAWFKGLGVLFVLAILAGAYALVQYLRTRKLLREESKARQVTQERLRISRELHDNIGARLTHIISSLDIELFKKERDDTSLANINRFARDTMGQLRETIWAVEESTIYFAEFARRVEQYVLQTNQMSELTVNFEQEGTEDFELNSVQTINFYRIVQEALNNALKYSEGSTISVMLKQADGKQELIVQDDGKGFDVSNAARGTGLRSMTNRAEEAGASLSVQSKSGEGTTVNLSFSMK